MPNRRACQEALLATLSNIEETFPDIGDKLLPLDDINI